MGWSEWKDFDGGGEGIAKKWIGTINATSTSSVNKTQQFSVRSKTDKYKELTEDNFFIEIRNLEIRATAQDANTMLTSSAFIKSYDSENGDLAVTCKVTNNNKLTAYFNVYMVC